MDDVDSAISFLKQKFPKHVITKYTPPVALRSQLYAILKNRTILDRGLAARYRRNELRPFIMQKSSDDVAVAATDDVVSSLVSLLERDLHARAKRQELPKARRYGGTSDVQSEPDAPPTAKRARVASAAGEADAAAVGGGEPPVVPLLLSSLPAKDRPLVRLLRKAMRQLPKTTPAEPRISNAVLTAALRSCLKEPPSESLVQRAIQRLVELHVLITADATSFWWCVPSGGALLAAVIKARNEIVSRLRRRKFHRMWMHELELSQSTLPLSFHVRDVVGRDIVEQEQQRGGTLLQLPADFDN
eukprot:TRINITY_DN1736_c0_g1_i1.p1 TRINITY_DN1736_c0_g1~~TRINITY_DN1736_c0_g1_i1.p1  ORF type:complete len:319 (-),score=40.11 TRINITY_DN1736_c0_g1_i1:52-957(-)